MSKEHFTRQVLVRDNNHVNMQKLASFVILLGELVLLALVALFLTHYLSALLAISGFLG